MKELLFNIIYYPLPLLWFLVLLLIFVKKCNLYFYLRIFCFLIYVSLTPFFSYLFELPLRLSVNNFEKGSKYSLVLVPTAGIYKDAQNIWHPSSNTIMRVSRGEILAKELNVPLLISGGITNNLGVSEASGAEKYLSYQNIIYDHNSKNSYETLLYLNKIYKNTKPKYNILIVTSPKHSMRMSLLLSSNGYSVSCFVEKLEIKINFYSFLPDSRTINSINSSLYEYLAIIKYIFLKYISISDNYE